MECTGSDFALYPKNGSPMQDVSDLRRLDTGPLIYALVNAVKELAAQNETLQTRIAALEAAR